MEAAPLEYDWVINKLRSRGFKTLQDRRSEAEDARRARLAAWEAEKARRLAAGESLTEKTPEWWDALKVLPGADKEKKAAIPEELMTEEQLEEKRLREKWGGTVAESVPISDLKTINEIGYIPRSQSTCFRCGQKGHWSRDCPQNTSRNSHFSEERRILSRNRTELNGRDATHFDKTLLQQRERFHYAH